MKEYMRCNWILWWSRILWCRTWLIEPHKLRSVRWV